MSTPNVPSQTQNDARYATPASVSSAISAQAATTASQYVTYDGTALRKNGTAIAQPLPLQIATSATIAPGTAPTFVIRS